MIAAAIYSRKSTEQDVTDAEKSVVRQIALARAFADSKGWTVIEEYVDDGISGRETAKLVNRARILSIPAATAGSLAGTLALSIARTASAVSPSPWPGRTFRR